MEPCPEKCIPLFWLFFSVGVLAVCPSPGKRWVRPLYNHPPAAIPDELARTLAQLRPPAAWQKRTAAQAGLSAGPPQN